MKGQLLQACRGLSISEIEWPKGIDYLNSTCLELHSRIVVPVHAHLLLSLLAVSLLRLAMARSKRQNLLLSYGYIRAYQGMGPGKTCLFPGRTT